MQLQSWKACPPLRSALLATIVALPSSFAFADEGPFSGFSGLWTGSGTITSTNGVSERLRCRAKYYVSPSGLNLDQQLRCASDSYRFDVNSGLVREENGTIAGTWTEMTRNATGSVRAQERGDSIVAKIAGPSFTADMTVTTRGDHQSVAITPNGGGSDIASVTINLHQE
ncbi:MAG TPA: hypothetical protein VKS78_18430 [Roseiarcus sp.]|nr:hypothetical protein [Roseiarcus sp.]